MPEPEPKPEPEREPEPAAENGPTTRLAHLVVTFALLFATLAVPPLVARPPPGGVLAATAALGILLTALAAYDLDRFRLPDALTVPLLGLGLAATWAIGASEVWSHALAALGAGLGLWLAGRMYHALRGREGLGLGDVKLVAALGAWVGPEGLATTLLLACLAALTALVVARALGRVVDATTPVAFGVFLALGGWTTWLYGPLV